MAWDIHGKTILVTGATSGIGLETSVELARLGARLVMVGRDPGRTEAAVSDAVARSGSREVSHLLCDFSSQASIHTLAADFLTRHDRLHVLVNNAGGVNKKRRLTVGGWNRDDVRRQPPRLLSAHQSPLRSARAERAGAGGHGGLDRPPQRHSRFRRSRFRARRLLDYAGRMSARSRSSRLADGSSPAVATHGNMLMIPSRHTP